MSIKLSKEDSNHVLDFALNYKFEEYKVETGLERIVAYGDQSGKCPVYLRRTPPCQNTCPAGEDIRGYNNILRGVEKTGIDGQPVKDKWAEAFYRIVERNPFPSVMGRVCPAPCEGKCNRKDVDETVGINSMEHYVGDYGIEKNLPIHAAGKDTGKHIAVVGAGPGGLSAAYQLRRMGHKVTIIEGQSKPGGMVRYGIMGYRVDRKVLDAEIKRILDLGVEVKYNTWVGKDTTLAKLRETHDAVFVAIGAQKGRALPIPGAEGTPRVSNAIDFLMEYELKGSHLHPGKKVLVIGDGNVAMDVARLARRLGSESTVISGVPKAEMACFEMEQKDAEVEGTKFEYQVGTVEVVRDGDNVKGLKCIKMAKKEKGEDGWNHPVPFFRYKPVAGTEFVIEGDLIVASIGQGTDISGFDEIKNDRGLFKIDPITMATSIDGVFAGGDIIKIDLITTAIGHGRRAAEAINEYVYGKALPSRERVEVIGIEQLKSDYFTATPRKLRGNVHPAKVEGNWDEVLQKLSTKDAEAEVLRCMSCGMCFECKQCMLFCPQDAIQMFRKNPVGEVMFTDYTKCIGCHICAESCPTGYIKMGMGEDQ
jgi:NADPH-dependent glutamate synthase beta subunit-like oxidoreductase